MTQYSLGGLLTGALFNSALGSFHLKKSSVPHSEIENYRQLIRNGISARRGLINSHVFDSVNDINNYISQMRKLSNMLNVPEKSLRDLLRSFVKIQFYLKNLIDLI